MKGGDVLISRTKDSHKVYQMSKNLEPPTFRKRGKKRPSTALGAPTDEASDSNVAVSQSNTIEQEETEQEEEEQETSISEMLQYQLESPHEQVPKRRKMTLRSARASVTREDEAEATEEEESETPTPPKKVTGKNLAALKRQTTADTGRSMAELATPSGTKTFKESVYRQDRGSTRIWGGKGRGKAGR